MIKDRIPWIDMAKGIGIILVIFAHAPIPSFVQQFIYSFHMPLFFFLSGYLFYNDQNYNFRDFFIKKIKALIVPYFCFSAIMYLYWLQKSVRHNLIGTSYHGTIMTPIWGTIYGIRGEYWGAHNGTMWFLACLFLTEILFYLFWAGTKTNKRGIVSLLAICSIIGYLYSSMVSIPLPWSFDAALTAIVFYGTGYLIREYEVISTENSSNFKVMLLLLAINLGAGFSQEMIDMFINNYHNYILFYLAAFSGIGFFLIVVRNMKIMPAISFIGKNSIILLAMHQFLVSPFVEYVYHFIPHIGILQQLSFFYGILVTIGTIVVCIPIIFVINAYFPFIIGKRGRGISKIDTL